jgi:hypothetical protein
MNVECSGLNAPLDLIRYRSAHTEAFSYRTRPQTRCGSVSARRPSSRLSIQCRCAGMRKTTFYSWRLWAAASILCRTQQKWSHTRGNPSALHSSGWRLWQRRATRRPMNMRPSLTIRHSIPIQRTVRRERALVVVGAPAAASSAATMGATMIPDFARVADSS